jgi:hypothetical protein
MFLYSDAIGCYCDVACSSFPYDRHFAGTVITKYIIEIFLQPKEVSQEYLNVGQFYNIINLILFPIFTKGYEFPLSRWIDCCNGSRKMWIARTDCFTRSYAQSVI